MKWASGEERKNPLKLRVEEKGVDRPGRGGSRSRGILNSLHSSAPSKYNGTIYNLKVSSSHILKGIKRAGEIHFDNITQ